MTESSRDPDSGPSDEEIARYRRAAEETLDQLDWCVKYLYRIRKSQIAAAIDKNRATIQRQMSTAN
jgi:hypothetical protein